MNQSGPDFKITPRGNPKWHKQMSVFQGELKILHNQFCSTGATPGSVKAVKAQFARLLEILDQKEST